MDLSISKFIHTFAYTYQEGTAPQGLCHCRNVTSCLCNDKGVCSKGNTSFQSLNGTVAEPVMTAGDASFVLFTELYTRVARSDLRIFFNLVPFSFSSDQFKISAGRLNSLEVLPDPSAVCLHI